jgi:hypothetical protein
VAKLKAAKLKDVAIDGDEASGVLEYQLDGADMAMPVRFERANERWLVEISDGLVRALEG